MVQIRKYLNRSLRKVVFLLSLLICCSWVGKDPLVIYLIGDSTMADYADNYEEGVDYYKVRYPQMGWGQVFQEFFVGADLSGFPLLSDADSVTVDDRAYAGRSTRTFFQEGRWRSVYESLRKDDIVLIQFGHNDGAVDKQERYVNIDGYKEFLRLFVSQTREKNAIPIILTPVCRNYPWENGHLKNVHGDYPQAAMDVATEMGVSAIDLNQLSMNAFSEKGRDYVTQKYFLNLPPALYEAYPDGVNDNTHFQPEGARAVAKLVFDAMKTIYISNHSSSQDLMKPHRDMSNTLAPEIEEIKRLTMQFEEGFNTRDIDKMMALYADKYTDVNMVKPKQTKEERTQYYQNILGKTNSTIKITPLDILVTGDQASVWGEIELKNNLDNSLRLLRYIEVWKKTKDKWQSVWGIDADLHD